MLILNYEDVNEVIYVVNQPHYVNLPTAFVTLGLIYVYLAKQERIHFAWSLFRKQQHQRPGMKTRRACKLDSKIMNRTF